MAASHSIHVKNLQFLITEVYKTLHNLNPSYVWAFYEQKEVNYDLRIKNLCKLPTTKTTNFGVYSLSSRGSPLWNTLDDEIKYSYSFSVFKKNIANKIYPA